MTVRQEKCWRRKRKQSINETANILKDFLILRVHPSPPRRKIRHTLFPDRRKISSVEAQSQLNRKFKRIFTFRLAPPTGKSHEKMRK
jgi:hypothetical protein